MEFVKARPFFLEKNNGEIHKARQKSSILTVCNSEPTGGERNSKDLNTHLITSLVCVLNICRIKTSIVKLYVFWEPGPCDHEFH